MKYTTQPEISREPVASLFMETCLMPEKQERTLSDFGKISRMLAEMLEEDYQLGLIEQVFIENHLHILQMAYNGWQRRNTLKINDPPK